jgi:hypothetical protein
LASASASRTWENEQTPLEDMTCSCVPEVSKSRTRCLPASATYRTSFVTVMPIGVPMRSASGPFHEVIHAPDGSSFTTRVLPVSAT